MPPNNFAFSQVEFAAKLFEPESSAPDGVVDPRGIAAPKRYSVYKNNVIVSYLEALAAAYPACKNLVGEQFFNAIGRAYLLEVPPNSQLMILFGAGFAEFVEGYEPAKQIPFLPDVAKLERAWRLAYHSADVASISQEKLTALPAEQLGDATIEFLPSVAVIHSQFPLISLWSAATSMSPLDGIDPQQPESAFIVRPVLDVQVQNIALDHFASVSALSEGQTLNQAAEAGYSNNEDFEFSALFGFLIQSGAIADIHLNTEGNT